MHFYTVVSTDELWGGQNELKPMEKAAEYSSCNSHVFSPNTAGKLPFLFVFFLKTQTLLYLN